MKAQTTTQMMAAKVLFLTTFSIVIATSAFAQSKGRKVIDPKSNPYAKLVGELTQVKDAKGAGNAFIVGSEGCHIVTNYHVPFAKSKDQNTGEIETIDNADVGQVVNVAVHLDAKTGKFKRQMKAKVIEFGNYEATSTRGLVGDVAVLQLESCLGKEYAGPELDRPEQGKFVPTGSLTTLSTGRNDKGLNEIFVEEGCLAQSRTQIAGAMFSSCHAEEGMSGSMILEKSADGKDRLVGMTTRYKDMNDGSRISIAIYSRALNKIIDSAIGEQQPLAIAPLAEQRAPQSTEKTALVKTKPSTVVR